MNVYYNQFKINCSKVVVFFQKLCHKSIYNYFLCLFKKCWIFRNVSCNFYLLAKKKKHQRNKLWLKNFVTMWMKLWYKILIALCLVTSIFSYWIHKKQSCKKKTGIWFCFICFLCLFFLIFKRVGLSLTFLDYFDLL